MTDVAEFLSAQHTEMRALLADLARQHHITEAITGPQLRARRRVMLAIQHRFVAQTAMRLRYLWPALCRAWPEGRSYTRAAWGQAQLIEYRLAKREWYGERDSALADLEAHIASDISDYLASEADQLGRLAATVDEAGVAGGALVDRLRNGGPWPTHPHPDLPRSPRLAALMLGPLAMADRTRDRLSRGRE